MYTTYYRIFSFKSTGSDRKLSSVSSKAIYRRHLFLHSLANSLEISAPSSDSIKICVGIYCLWMSSPLSVSDTHPSILLPKEKASWNIAGNRDSSRCLNTVSSVPVQWRTMFLCVLSEVTNWRLWFLSWAPALALDHPHWRPTGRTLNNIWLIWETKSLGFVVVRYAHALFISPIISCWLDQHTIAHASNASCRLLRISWGMLFFFQMMTLLEFAFKDTGPATRVTGSVCTCQTRSTSYFPAPVFYWRLRSLSCSKSLSAPVHNLLPSVSVQTVQTEESHLGKPRALNENWWQISH